MLEPREEAWARSPISDRLAILKKFRHRLTQKRDPILAELGRTRIHSSRGELLSSELVPLMDACLFLERSAPKILASKKLGRAGQPAWLWGVETEVHREPLGRILVLGPSNYPLFLPIVQSLQAWAAGNVVWLKSAPGTLKLHQLIQDIFLECGGDQSIFRLLGESNEAYSESLPEVQKVVLVGSRKTGEIVLEQAGKALVPCIAELSGWDTVFIHPDADRERAAQAVAFGLSLNQGQTCVAPRRILIQGELESFERHFLEAIKKRPKSALSQAEVDLCGQLESCEARILSTERGYGPVLAGPVPKHHHLLQEESFGPIAVLCQVASDQEALEVANRCPYALGASLLGPEDWAQSIAHHVPAQVVSINDVIVPTADPRVSFGGSGKSGFGRMRGAEGLLEMSQTRTISVRQGGSLDHLQAPGPLDDLIVEKFLLFSHSGTLWRKTKALADMILAISKERIRKRRAKRMGGIPPGRRTEPYNGSTT